MYIKTSEQECLELGFYGYECNWGIHIAGLYETEAERDEIVLGFITKGIEAGDLELYCPTERTKADFSKQFSQAAPSLSAAIEDEEHLILYTAKELYYPDGTFSPIAMDEGLSGFYERSQAHGRRNVRATAEMVWALEAIPGKEHLMAYESRLNYFIPGKPWISICLYNVNKFSGAIVMDVLRTHPYVISKGVLTENPYFQDPDIWLAENAPQFLPETLSKW